MVLVFDTSALSLLLANDEATVLAVSDSVYDSLLIPLATDAEIRFGYAYGTRQAVNLENYEAFKQRFDLRVVEPNQDTSLLYADLATWCRQNGVSLANNDLWIAAACVQAGGKLLTIDKDFARVPQISLAAI